MLRKCLPLLILLLFPLVVYWPLSLCNYWVTWDNPDYFFPVCHFISDCYHHGVMPSWNPYEYLGIPMHADPQSGFWYPVTWLIVITRGYDIYGSNIDYLIHLALAGIGMFAFLRGRGISVYTACLVAMCYQGCGFFVSDMECLNWVVSAAWLPMVLYFFFELLERPSTKTMVGTAATLSMMMTGGYPAFFFLLFYLLLVIVIVRALLLLKAWDWGNMRSSFIWLASSAVLFTIFSSGYLYSMSQAWGWFSRTDGLDLYHAAQFPFSPQCFMSFIVPFSVVNNTEFFGTDMSMANGYLGLVPLVFAVVGIFIVRQWQLRVLLGFGVVCLLAALGSSTPVRGIMFHSLPFMNLFRFSSIFRLYFMVAMFPVAAYAIDAVVINGQHRKALAISFTTIGIGAIALIVWAIASGGAWQAPPVLELPKMFRFVRDTSMFNHIVFHGAVQLVLLSVMGLFLFIDRLEKARKIFIATVVVFDILFTVQLNAACSILTDCSLKTSTKALAMQPTDFPIPSGNIGEWSNGVIRVPPAWMNQGLFAHKVSAAAYNPFMLKGFEQLRKSPLWPEVESHPLVYLQNNTISKPSVTSFMPNEVAITVNTASDAVLVFQQNDYPGWQCVVDGNPMPMVNVNGSEMGVQLKEGAHRVVFQFKPFFLIPLMCISFGGIIMAFVFLLMRASKSTF